MQEADFVPQSQSAAFPELTTDVNEWISNVSSAIDRHMTDSDEHQWLLKQSNYTHFQRLITISNLGLTAGRILDVGAGTGALTFDLGWLQRNNGVVTAVDNDQIGLDILSDLADELGISVQTKFGDAYDLPIESSTQDLTVARLLLQHLDKPVEALREMARVTQPGGKILVMDIDDGVSVSDSESSPAFKKLRSAVNELQGLYGGDRKIGRKLYRYMKQAGMTDIQVILMPAMRLGNQSGRDSVAEAYQVERFVSKKDDLLTARLITEEEFEAGIEELKASFAEDRFELEAQFVVVGSLPG